MKKYIRSGNVILVDGGVYEQYKSINEAKRWSRTLQSLGNKVSLLK